jgi:hypothetical protein
MNLKFPKNVEDFLGNWATASQDVHSAMELVKLLRST